MVNIVSLESEVRNVPDIKVLRIAFVSLMYFDCFDVLLFLCFRRNEPSGRQMFLRDFKGPTTTFN